MMQLGSVAWNAVEGPLRLPITIGWCNKSSAIAKAVVEESIRFEIDTAYAESESIGGVVERILELEYMSDIYYTDIRWGLCWPDSSSDKREEGEGYE